MPRKLARRAFSATLILSGIGRDWMSRRPVKTYLVLLILAFLSSFQCRKQKRARPALRANVGDDIDPRPDPIRVAINNDGWPPDNRGHDRKEEKYWNRSIAISAAALGAAVVAALFAGGAYLAANDQATSARRQADIASNPYIFSKFVGSQSIFDWIHLQDSISVGVVYTNYGQAPGTVVLVKCGIFYGQKGTYSQDNQNDLKFGANDLQEPVDIILATKDASEVHHCPIAWPNNKTAEERKASKDLNGSVFIAYTRGIFAISEYTYVSVENKRFFGRDCFEFIPALGARGDDRLAFARRQSNCDNDITERSRD